MSFYESRAALKNVTITLDEETALWARVYAAQHNTSMSRMIGEMLAQRMIELRDYDRSMRQYLRRQPSMLKGAGKRYPKRDALHDRTRLR